MRIAKPFFRVLTAIALSSTVCAANAVTVWNEASQGELSGNGLAPTLLSVAAGSNQVLGTVGDAGSGVDRDYFSIVVPAGAKLLAVRLLSNTQVSGGASFFAIQAGPQVTTTPTGGGVEALLGFVHFENSNIGSDLLPLSVFAYSGPLASGIYSFWVQETGGQVPYGLDFQISAVPEPANVLLLAAGVFGLLCRGARRRR